MMFDCRSASAQKKSITEALISALVSRMIRHIKVNDANRRGPGSGNTKFGPILKTSVKNGYKGHISAEVFEFDPDSRTIASRRIGYLRETLETSTYEN